MYITLQDLLPLFAPYRYINNSILLVPPSDFRKLAGRSIGGVSMFMLVTHGSQQIELNGKPYTMDAQSCLDIMDMDAIRLKQADADVEAWCLFATFSFASESLKNLRPGPYKPLPASRQAPILALSAKECQVLENQLRLLANSLMNTKHFYRQELIKLYFRSFNLELGNILFVRKETPEAASPYVSKQDFVTLDFIKLVAKHFATEHNIKFYADNLCLSTKHLTRIIKAATGKTPHTILRTRIVHQAMAMLEDNNISIGQIAEELHFSDQAAFCKFFKKQLNVAPTTYRKKSINEVLLAVAETHKENA